MLVNGGVILR